jgi:hypothetical protein
MTVPPFEITDRALDVATGEARFTYRLGDDEFTERLTLDPALLRSSAPEQLDAALDLVHLVMGTSYYKLRAPGRISVRRPVSKAQFAVAEAAYSAGLGEFAAVNGLPLPHAVEWDVEVRDAPAEPPATGDRGALLPVGGGKDSRSTRPTPSATSPTPPAPRCWACAAGWTRCSSSARGRAGSTGTCRSPPSTPRSPRSSPCSVGTTRSSSPTSAPPTRRPCRSAGCR